MRRRWRGCCRACARLKSAQRSRRRSRLPRAPRAPVTRCSCLRRAPASTCSRTTDSAARCSCARCRSWPHEQPRGFAHGPLAQHRHGRRRTPRCRHHRAHSRHRAVRPGDGDLRIGVNRKPGERPAVLLPRAAAAADGHRAHLRRAAVRPAHRTPGACRPGAARRGDRALDAGAGAGRGACGQRQPPLAAPRAGSFQVSELARVLVLIFIASYAVRREEQLRESLAGLCKPLGLLFLVGALLLAEPDFGAATVLFATGFGLLFLAGARLRYVIAMTVLAGLCFGLLAVSSSYRLKRLTVFLDPWAHPYTSGFQLTQSLIAIGRGQWFGVGLGDSVQKLFYLPEAHTDFLFAVLAEELGLVGVVLTLALFLGLVWRSFWIARLASRAGLKFPAYLAAGFGLWIGIQAFINIGVNMGVLPTKGLTLPLMSYGRSSLIVALAWVGLVLRVHHETVRGTRRSE